MIRLKASDPEAEGLKSLLSDALKHAAKEPGIRRAQLYSSVGNPNELALSLMWDTDFPEYKGSRAGLCISQALQAFGLVELTVWMEQTIV